MRAGIQLPLTSSTFTLLQCIVILANYGVYPGRVCNPHPWEQYPANTRTQVMGMGRVRVWVGVWLGIPQGLPMPLPTRGRSSKKFLFKCNGGMGPITCRISNSVDIIND